MANNQFLSYGGDLMLFAHSGASVQPLAFSTSSKLTVNLATREISSRDSGNWKESAAGKLDWSVSSDSLLSFSATGTTQSFEELYNYQINRCPVNIAFAHKTGTSPSWTVDSSKKKFTGCGFITSLDVNSQDNDNATYSVNIIGSGPLSIA